MRSINRVLSRISSPPQKPDSRPARSTRPTLDSRLGTSNIKKKDTITMSNTHDSTTLNQLLAAFRESWPNLANALENHIFPEDSNPTPLLSTIASTTNTPEKSMFCSLLKCFDDKFGDLCTKLGDKYDINKTESELNSLKIKLAEQNTNLNFAHQEIMNLRETVEKKTQQLETRISDITTLNTRISKLNSQVSSGNEQIYKLQSQISNSIANAQSVSSISTTVSKPQRTRSDQESLAKPRRTQRKDS